MMNQEDIFKKVGQILKELQDQYEFLAQNPGQLNELELELFLANANFLSDHVQIVKKINSNKALKAISEHSKDQSPVIIPAPPARAPESNDPEMTGGKTLDELAAEYTATNEEEPALKFQFRLDEEPSTDKFEFEGQSVNTIFDRRLSKEEEEIIAQKQRLRVQQQQRSGEDAAETAGPEPALSAVQKDPEPVQQVATPDKVEEKLVSEATTEPVADKVEEKIVKQPEAGQIKPTLNDMLAGKASFPASLNEERNKTTITDLKQAINLNEKLLFIKDLFNGYNLAYAEAIELINKMPDFKSADTFLQQNYAVKNNWASKQSTVDQFYELLNQRFPAK